MGMTRSNGSVNIRVDKKYFVSIFVIKDMCTWTFYGIVRAILMLVLINVLRDVENYLSANPLVTPDHIKPEWYFLFAYAILRCIPEKTVGVIGLVVIIIMGLVNMVLYAIGLYISFMMLTWLRR